jgi:hypothetical protein
MVLAIVCTPSIFILTTYNYLHIVFISPASRAQCYLRHQAKYYLIVPDLISCVITTLPYDFRLDLKNNSQVNLRFPSI